MDQELHVLETIRDEMDAIPGDLGFYYKNLATGREFGVQADGVFPAASVIKFPLYLHVLRQAAEGGLRMEDRLTVSEEDKVPLSGALTLFSGPVETDIRTLCRLMISLSDNTAANRLIRHCTMEGVGEGFRRMGLEKTALRRALFDCAASDAGIQNTICPAEMGRLLEQLYQKEFVSPEVSQEALNTLLLQQVDHKLGGKLCGRVKIAHKTGEDANLSSDVGIVYAPKPFVVCFAGYDTDVYRWEDLMRRGAYDLVKAQAV